MSEDLRDELYVRMSRLEARDFVFRDEDPRKARRSETYVRLDALSDLFRDLGGTTTHCPLDGPHEHAFRGPHRFHEWEPGT